MGKTSGDAKETHRRVIDFQPRGHAPRRACRQPQNALPTRPPLTGVFHARTPAAIHAPPERFMPCFIHLYANVSRSPSKSFPKPWTTRRKKKVQPDGCCRLQLEREVLFSRRATVETLMHSPRWQTESRNLFAGDDCLLSPAGTAPHRLLQTLDRLRRKALRARLDIDPGRRVFEKRELSVDLDLVSRALFDNCSVSPGIVHSPDCRSKARNLSGQLPPPPNCEQ